MKWHNHILNASICLTLLIGAATAYSQETKNSNRVTGALGIATKYDSNINLAPGAQTNHDLINEFLGRLTIKRDIGGKTWLETRLSGLANWHVKNSKKNWYFGRASLSMGYNFGQNEVGFSNELRTYILPKESDTSFYRNTAIINYRRKLSPRW